MAATTTTTAPTATTSDAFDSPAVLAESVEMLRTIMRTSDKESARLSAARTLANLAARFITRRPSTPRDTDHPEPPRGQSLTTDDTAPSASTAPSSAAPQTVPAPINTSSRQPQPSPASAHPRRAARSRRVSAASATSATTTTTLARAAGAAASPTSDTHTAAAPTRRFVTAIPPLIDKHYPAPNAVLDPLFDILASPIPTDPMTEAELDDLQAIHVNLKREDLKNPRRAARWRHQLREDRFWKAYWQEWRKNPDEFKRVYEAFMNRKPAPDATTAPDSASISPAISPPEPLASASAPDTDPSPAPIIPSPPHPIINSS